MRTYPILIAIAAALAAATASGCATEDEAATDAPTFEAVVERVLEPSCTFGSCHAASPQSAANLDLTPEAVCDMLINQPSCLFPDRMRVVPGHPEQSFFFHKLTGDGLHQMPAPTGECATGETRSNLLMPYGAQALGAEEIELVRGWIAAGAQCTGSQQQQKPAGPSIASFTADRTLFDAGEAVTFTVTLDQPAPEGGLPIYIETYSSAVSAPLQVSVPSLGTTVSFEGFAMRPTSRFTMRARGGRGAKDLVLRVGGLEVAEVLADPVGTDDGLQWIKLYNRTSLPLDLGGYKLKAGQGNYEAITVDLVGSIPAGGCAVIGGPVQSGANSEPIYEQLANFTPDLPHASGQAVGFAVFDETAVSIGGLWTPVDALLIGEHNAALLRGPDAQIASPSCGTPVAGMSALRTGEGACVQALMQPRTCF